MVAVCHLITKTQLDRFNRNFLQCWLIHPEVTQAYCCLDNMFIVSRWQWAAPFVCRHNHKVQEAVRSILRYSLPWKLEQKSKSKYCWKYFPPNEAGNKFISSRIFTYISCISYFVLNSRVLVQNNKNKNVQCRQQNAITAMAYLAKTGQN